MKYSASDGVYLVDLPVDVASEPGVLLVKARLGGLVYKNGMGSPPVDVETTIPIGDAVDLGVFGWREGETPIRIGPIDRVRILRGGRLGSASRPEGNLE